MQINFLGGALEVGASCIFLKINNKNILMDCGIRQSASKDPLPDFRIIQELGGVDAIIVSHAHLDHTGSLPIISKEYPNARIYMNNMTKDLVRVLLYDSLKVMNNREAEIPLYAEKDVQEMLDRIFVLNYEVDFPIFDDIKITFYNAGHIAGASCVYIKTPEGALFYSGDFSIFSQKSVEGAKVPRLRPDVAILESTYGDKLHSNRQIEEDKLIEIVQECINNNGKMLIPAFALGRAQEILLILKKGINKGKLKNAKIYVDGMIKNINTVYKLNPLYLKNSLGKKILKGTEPFYDDNIIPVLNKDEREKLISKEEPLIIVSSSGMLTGGPSQYYAEKIATMENGYIVITGYQDEEAPGRKLLNLLNQDKKYRTLEINNKKVPVKCTIKQVGLSAHGDKNEIKALINRLGPRNLFLVHGDENVIKNLSLELSAEIRGKIYIPKCGDSIEVFIKKPRKQWKKSMPFTLKEKGDLSEYTIQRLWEFVIKKYNEKLFTVEELIYIWSGSIRPNVSEVKNAQKIIAESVYFESDNKRLFLFKARKEEKVLADLKPKELKQNEIDDLVKEYFSEFNYRKSSFILNEKKVVLNFDFPKVVNNKIYDKIKSFKEKYLWEVEINSQINNNAVEIMIKDIFKNANIKKISFFPEDNKVVVNILQPYDMKNELKIFKKNTGINLEVIFLTKKEESIETLEFNNLNNEMEQNQALNFIEFSFKDEKFKPYKKSIKRSNTGKYIELSFISPVIGRKYNDKVKKISQKIGWNITISNLANQNEIINTAIRYCSEYNVDLKKNPSFNPSNLTITLKLKNIHDKVNVEKFKVNFQNETGCKLIY
ncbi:ribonuclease [Clostridium acetireducens DSM 10703]|uniref:Ribonuclease n=1 Tax=Clostridium acetireducens DSM 10703 TaxID=1121290 RepID=A0A1E8EXS7_9CLOT|nr:ribonuclease [Clostridium acetireducens DSM 10703]